MKAPEKVPEKAPDEASACSTSSGSSARAPARAKAYWESSSSICAAPLPDSWYTKAENAPAKAPAKMPECAPDVYEKAPEKAPDKEPWNYGDATQEACGRARSGGSSTSSIYAGTKRSEFEIAWATQPLRQAPAPLSVAEALGLTEQEYELMHLSTAELDRLEQDLSRWVPDSDMASFAFRRLWGRRNLSPERMAEFKRVGEWNRRAVHTFARAADLALSAAHSPSALMRYHAMLFMVRVQPRKDDAQTNPEHYTAAIERGLSDSNLYVRVAALGAALKYHGSDMRTELLQRSMADRSPVVRVMALLRVREGDRALLEERARIETHPRVLWALVEAAARLEDFEDFDAFAKDTPLGDDERLRAMFVDTRDHNLPEVLPGQEYLMQYFGGFGSLIFGLAENGMPRRRGGSSASSVGSDFSVSSVTSDVAFY